MITTMRGCVAHNDLWPWPISSRSFGLDLENRVCSEAFTVLDGFFLYLAQMITIIRGGVASYVFFRIWKFEFLANFVNFSALTLKKKSTVLDGFFPYLIQMITSMRGCVAYRVPTRSLFPGKVITFDHGSLGPGKVLSFSNYSKRSWKSPYFLIKSRLMNRCLM